MCRSHPAGSARTTALKRIGHQLIGPFAFCLVRAARVQAVVCKDGVDIPIKIDGGWCCANRKRSVCSAEKERQKKEPRQRSVVSIRSRFSLVSMRSI